MDGAYYCASLWYVLTNRLPPLMIPPHGIVRRRSIYKYYLRVVIRLRVVLTPFRVVSLMVAQCHWHDIAGILTEI